MSNWRGLAEAATAYPTGQSTVSRLALTADRIGFDGIVIRNAPSTEATAAVAHRATADEIELVYGQELSTGTIETISGRLPQLRKETTVLMVAGGTEQMNRFVARQSHVDVLTRPIDHSGPDLDQGVAKAAIEHEVAVEIDLSPLRSPGGIRVRYLDRLRRLWRIVEYYEVPYVLTIRPASHLELVAPREIVALAEIVGLDAVAARRGLATWMSIAERNREHAGEGFIEPGD